MQEANAACAIGRINGIVFASVQAAQSQPETLSGAHTRGGYRGIVAWRVLRSRGGDSLRSATVNFTQRQVGDKYNPAKTGTRIIL